MSAIISHETTLPARNDDGIQGATARAARRFPIILDLLGAGEVTLTAIRLLAPHLTSDNQPDVLERARHKGKREVELLVAMLHPRPDVPSAIRHAQDLLRHSVPDGDPAVIFERALALLVTALERSKTGATDRPRTARRANAASRHVPAAIKRLVWQRDGRRCAFSGPHGRCTATGFLEYHHVVPFAAGGETSARNFELRVARTISTRRIGTLALYTHRWFEKSVPCTA